MGQRSRGVGKGPSSSRSTPRVVPSKGVLLESRRGPRTINARGGATSLSLAGRDGHTRVASGRSPLD
eukprot:12212079-Alexandrium_andersonii.AAC.1